MFALIPQSCESARVRGGGSRTRLRVAACRDMDLRFVFTAELYQWEATAATWVFVSLPVEDAEEIREEVPNRRGFGSVRVAVQVGDTRWKTSIFPDSKTGTFVLPVKKDVRRAESIDIGDEAEFDLEIL
jgi:hypothetical protein